MITPKTGAGRKTSKAPEVPGVETLPCPAADGGNHELTNRGLGTVCRHCSQTWADLDAEVRAGLPRRAS